MNETEQKIGKIISEVKMFYTYGTQLMIDQELKAARDMAQTYNLIKLTRMDENERANSLLSTISSLTRSVMHRLEGLKSSQSADQVDYRSTC